MTSKQLKQIYSSLGAIALTIAFLWTGKKFIWNDAVPEIVKPGDPEASMTVPDQSIPDVTALTDLTNLSGDPVQSSSTTSTSAVTVLTDLSGSIITQSTALTSATTLSGNNLQSSSSSTQTTVSQQNGSSTASTSATNTNTTISTTVSTTVSNTVTPSGDFTQAPDGYFNDALFLGDSRMVGIASYAPFDGADYFATVGLATYKVANAKNEVGDKKNLTWNQLLTSKTYGKIYIMLGINEITNNRTTTIQKYQELIQSIHSSQPSAIIYICGNLHVTQAYNDNPKKTIKNESINSFNSSLESMCDNSTIYYLDVNPLFDDANGFFGAEYTKDGVHPLAKYYKTWAEWMTQPVIVK